MSETNVNMNVSEEEKQYSLGLSDGIPTDTSALESEDVNLGRTDDTTSAYDANENSKKRKIDGDDNDHMGEDEKSKIKMKKEANDQPIPSPATSPGINDTSTDDKKDKADKKKIKKLKSIDKSKVKKLFNDEAEESGSERSEGNFLIFALLYN
jgi:hypothetical protein